MIKVLCFWMIVLASCVAATAQSPTIVAQVSLTNQTTRIPKTTLVTPSADALYRVTAYLNMVGADNSSSFTCLTTGWSDNGGGRSQIVFVDSTLNQGVPTWLSTTFSARVKAGVPLVYSVSLCKGGVFNPYDLFITVEQLQ
jgi:hypothetical protein